MHKMLFWSGFGATILLHRSRCTALLTSRLPGVLVRIWQLGLEMRPFFAQETLWAYPFYAATGGAFGYWMMNVEDRQSAVLAEQKRVLLEKRKRRYEREAKAVAEKDAQAA